MRHFKLVTCILCTVLLSSVATLAQDDSDEAEHEALRGLKAAFEHAVNMNDMDTIAPFLDDGFSVVTFTDREFTDFETFKSRWQQTREEMLQGGTYSIKLLPVRSTIMGDIAITRGDSENIMVTGKGEVFKFTSHWTAVCKKTDGQWKILRGHNSLDPFGNPMLKSGVKDIAIKLSILCSAAGLLVGLMAGLHFGRRKRNQAPDIPASSRE